MKRCLAAIAILLTMAAHAWAGTDWASWSGYPASTRTGTFSSGHTITLTPAALPGSGSVAAGLGFDCVPDAPGMGGPDNPPYQQILSGAPSTLLDEGDLVAEIDLSDLPAGSRLLFGLADQKYALGLRLFDLSDAELPLDGIVVTDIHNYYPPSPPSFPTTWVADQNSTLINGTLSRDFINDADPTDFYNQTGLTILSGLHVATRRLLLLGTQFAEAEGLSIFVGVETADSIDVVDDSGAATDKTITFGLITVGATSITRKITVTNAGDSAIGLTVTPNGLEESEFAIVDGCPPGLASSGNCEITMAFHPTAAGPVSGSVDLSVDGGDPVPVSVSGTGTLAKTGDANGDGVITATDALHVLRVAVGSLPLTDSILAACDMNDDGQITAVDALAVLRKSVGL